MKTHICIRALKCTKAHNQSLPICKTKSYSWSCQNAYWKQIAIFSKFEETCLCLQALGIVISTIERGTLERRHGSNFTLQSQRASDSCHLSDSLQLLSQNLQNRLGGVFAAKASPAHLSLLGPESFPKSTSFAASPISKPSVSNARSQQRRPITHRVAIC